MFTTINHGLTVVEPSDDILDSIDKIGKNFEYIDEKLDEMTSSLDLHLDIGRQYTIGQKIWNEAPSVGGYAGWINVRTGLFAHKWQPNTPYAVGDLVMSTMNNGNVYQVITEGTSSALEPIFPIAIGGTILDIRNYHTWQTSYVYSVGDTMIATNGDTTYFYRCVASGTSGITEPTWVNTSGATQVDGSVTWICHKTVEWKQVNSSCEFRQFGKII